MRLKEANITGFAGLCLRSFLCYDRLCGRGRRRDGKLRLNILGVE